MFALFAAMAVGCENYDLDLHQQQAHKMQEYPRFQAPEGSVPQGSIRVDYSDFDGADLKSPLANAKMAVENGKKLYDIYCIPCHGADGSTKGAPVADKFDPDSRPVNLLEEDYMELTEGDMFMRIVDGIGAMPSYRRDLSDKEAWEVVAYTLKLQKR
jgi:mono/diheme cytochrome c family protein